LSFSLSLCLIGSLFFGGGVWYLVALLFFGAGGSEVKHSLSFSLSLCLIGDGVLSSIER
jgi:hypothetical protein